MVASLLRIITTGIQDERIYFSTKQASLYPFQKVWIKAGRFTTRMERLDFENVPTFGNTAFFKILRKGHLVTRLFLVATMPDIYSAQRDAATALNSNAVFRRDTAAYPRFGWTNSLGHALINQLTLDIASYRVETIDSQLLEILDEFHTSLEKVPIVNKMIKRADSGFNEQMFGLPPNDEQTVTGFQETVVVPLPFWFTRGDTGCALPIDAMSTDEIRVGINIRSLDGLYYTTTQLSSSPITNEQGTALWPIQNSQFYAHDPVAVPNQSPLLYPNGTAIHMPLSPQLSDCYIMAEYVYLDQTEASRFRLADLQVPVVQHYAMPAYDTRGLLNARIRLDIPNPTRDLFFFCQPFGANNYNAHFLATRELTGTVNTLPNGSQMPWWPDAQGLSDSQGLSDAQQQQGLLKPAFQLSDSEPISGYELDYQGSLVRFRTEAPALFRSILPSYEQRKSPWVNRYYYNIPLAIQNGFTPFSRPMGEANLDKMTNRDLVLQFRNKYGNIVGLNVGRFIVYIYAETYNVLRVFGGRAGLLFAY